MSTLNDRAVKVWQKVGPGFMPFAEIASPELPVGRLLRLSLFQVSVGMAVVLLIGTLNRVMIVELGMPAWLVALMISLPLLFAPYRAVVGLRSDNHRSVIGWKRVPYLWIGTMLQFGGLAIMPFSLILLSGDSNGPPIVGQIGAALAFLLVGAGMHTTQTVGLALATDIAPVHMRARVVSLLCGMLLVGMVISAVCFGLVLANFSEIRLIQVIQGSAVATLVLNAVALWKQEARDPSRTKANGTPKIRLADAFRSMRETGMSTRQLVAVGLGTMGFSMQDILLEPYGGQILHLPVGTTTILTSLLALGGLCGFLLSARLLSRDFDPFRLSAMGIVAGLAAFAAVIFADPLQSAVLFGIGTALIGFGGGLFGVGTLAASMGSAKGDFTGLVLGTWGAVQSAAAGSAIALGGILRDLFSSLAERGLLGDALAGPGVGYSVVYHVEIALLFATLVAIGPLVRSVPDIFDQTSLRPGSSGARIQPPLPTR